MKSDATKPQPPIKIGLKRKNPLRDRAFQRAIFYSLLFHALVFGLFRVKFIDHSEGVAKTSSLAVSIEMEPEQELPVTKTHEFLAPSADLTKFPGVSSNWDDLICNELFEKTHLAPIAEIRLSDDMAAPKAGKDPFFPLRIRSAKKIKALHLIEDGSSLFKEKSIDESAAFSYPLYTYSITYTVKIAGQSGKIVEWFRRGELLDKTLQECADKIIETIRFAPTQEAEIKGHIWLEFLCNGEELERYLK